MASIHPRTKAPSLWWINNNPIQVSPFIVPPIKQSPNGNGIAPALLERQLQRCRENNPLVRVALVQGLHILRVPVDDHAADPAQLPLAADAVRCSTGCSVRLAVD